MQKRKPLAIPNPRTTKTNRPTELHEDEKSYISRLPDQIPLEIFFKLSITSLIQCFRVCKTWRRVLSDPHFTKTPVSRTPSCLLVNGSGSTSPKYPNLHGNFLLDLNHTNVDGVTKLTSCPDATIVGSCNGFLCMYHDYSLVHGRFSVSNPMTGEILWVAPTEASFDSCGFGYSHISNVYKIVLFQRSVFTVMTVGSGIWRGVEYAADLIGYTSSIEPDWLYLNGFLHCICRRYDGTRLILAFDVESESFHRLALPDYYFNLVPALRIVGLELGALDGRLCVVAIAYIKMVVWVMTDEGLRH